MLLPTKRIPADRALLIIGAEVLKLLNEPKTVSKLWSEFQIQRESVMNSNPVPFDWFILALDLLYCLSAVSLSHGVLERSKAS